MVTWKRHAWDQDLGSGLWEKGQGLGACDYTSIQMVSEAQKCYCVSMSVRCWCCRSVTPLLMVPCGGVVQKQVLWGFAEPYPASLDAGIFKLKTYLVC